MDWHGQGRSPRLLPDPLKVHARDFCEYDADIAALMDFAAPHAGGHRPMALAHSMGGHMLLRALHDAPEDFSCAVLSAPMASIETRGVPMAIVGRAAEGMARHHAEDFVWGVNMRDPLTDRFDGNPVTSDAARWQRTQDFIVSHPDIRLVGPTWGWLAAAWHSMRAMADPRWAAKTTTPILICGAGADRICPVGDAALLARSLPCGEYVEINGARHEILMERDAIRADFWRSFDAFTARHVAAPET
jgi:lysophospholipase